MELENTVKRKSRTSCCSQIFDYNLGNPLVFEDRALNLYHILKTYCCFGSHTFNGLIKIISIAVYDRLQAVRRFPNPIWKKSFFLLGLSKFEANFNFLEKNEVVICRIMLHDSE